MFQPSSNSFFLLSSIKMATKGVKSIFGTNLFPSKMKVIVFVSILFLISFSQCFGGEFSDFRIDQSSQVEYREITNKSDHPFPYTASVIVCTCLFGIAAIIICLGGDLWSGSANYTISFCIYCSLVVSKLVSIKYTFFPQKKIYIQMFTL